MADAAMFESAEHLREEFAQLETALSDPATHTDLALCAQGRPALRRADARSCAGSTSTTA